MLEFKPSIFQRVIFHNVKNKKNNIIIDAVAGSGKTTTIVKAMDFIPPYKKVLFCAFNNHIVKTLKERAPSYVDVSTMHSIGWKAMMEYYGKPKLNEYKTYNIAEKVLHHIPKNQRFNYFYNLRRIIDLYRQNLVQDEKDLWELCAKHDVIASTTEMEDAYKVMFLMLENTTEFDFTDMVFMPAVNEDIILPTYDVVFADEVQDFNAAQHALLKRLVRKNGRLITVGDPNQSIYGFAGADTDGFQKIRKWTNTTKLPLSVSYRCAKNIVREAQTIVKKIKYSENSPEGSFREGSVMEIRYGDWVLCRNVKPLVILCLDMLRKGKKAHIKGNDIGKSIIHLLEQMKENDKMQALKKLDERKKDLKKKLSNFGVFDPDKHPMVIALSEKISIIEFMGKQLPSIKAIIHKLKKIFSDEVEGIMLSTIHKAKGLENDRVFLICPELIPSRFAHQPWQIKQEMNLKYVAITRAKKEFIIVKDFSLKKEKDETKQLELF